jgi:hypothetical protein
MFELAELVELTPLAGASVAEANGTEGGHRGYSHGVFPGQATTVHRQPAPAEDAYDAEQHGNQHHVADDRGD